MLSILRDIPVLVVSVIKITFYFIFVCFESFFRLIVPLPLKSLNEDTILVTGAASGIGKAICLEIVKVTNGKAKLVCWDINNDHLTSLMTELKEKGATAFPYLVDVGNRYQVHEASESVKRDVGNVTMVINNAGIMPCVKLLDQSDENIEKTMNVNVLAHFWIIKEFLPEMIKCNSGHIVAIASAGALAGSRNLLVYSSSKFAVKGYMEALEDELEEYVPKCKIKLSTVYPIWVNTSFAENHLQSRFKTLTTTLEPSDVAERLVSGVRRNYPNIYIPGLVANIHFLRIMPYKVQLLLRKTFSVYAVPPPKVQIQ